MSSKEGMEFGSRYGEDYGSLLERWGKRLEGVDEITDEMKKEWASDLRGALGKQLSSALVSGSSEWKRVGSLPSKETIDRFAKTAVKGSLTFDMEDLLVRLRDMAQEPDTLTAANTVSEAIKRVGQTVAQIYDMAKDRFNRIVEKHFKDEGKLTGRRRWRTVSMKSRHRSLNYKVRSDGEEFIFKGESVYGPRPPGGSPANWSNCSCRLEYERSNGDWV